MPTIPLDTVLQPMIKDVKGGASGSTKKKKEINSFRKSKKAAKK